MPLCYVPNTSIIEEEGVRKLPRGDVRSGEGYLPSVVVGVVGASAVVSPSDPLTGVGHVAVDGLTGRLHPTLHHLPIRLGQEVAELSGERGRVTPDRPGVAPQSVVARGVGPLYQPEPGTAVVVGSPRSALADVRDKSRLLADVPHNGRQSVLIRDPPVLKECESILFICVTASTDQSFGFLFLTDRNGRWRDWCVELLDDSERRLTRWWTVLREDPLRLC